MFVISTLILNKVLDSNSVLKQCPSHRSDLYYTIIMAKSIQDLDIINMISVFHFNIMFVVPTSILQHP